MGTIPEVHPRLTSQTCTRRKGCVTHQTSVVLDALTHPIRNIYTGKSCLNSTGGLKHHPCSTVEKCADYCSIEGADYEQHGIRTHGDSMTMRMYLKEDGHSKSVSPRVYLLDETGEAYSMLKLRGREVSFDVDVSNLPCGMNGALYLSEMSPTGGRSALNPAGATFGTGYCDAQCYNTSAFINGVANINQLGACCNEMDLWEANARATAFTPHACNVTSIYECSGAECGDDGVCDKSGCGYNPYALDAHKYYGYNDKVDTTKPFTVTTQFLTHDGTSAGVLDEIRRLYIQDGRVIHNAAVKFQGTKIDSITPAYCKSVAPSFQERGGLREMGEALHRGMVLVFAIWNDSGAYMNWLDAGNAGPCGPREGKPSRIEKNDPRTSVTFSNMKWGDLGSTCQYS